ncbi:gluconate 2-dehydrogenase subunit 3 family protein [Microbacterium sp. USHLN186]|uniref:gluconate 2-dehydrogenase subunit 3 family protein n=1 Tax=Microbacterium sp. USHLN186 TaxID=3081286 RepID=UPI003017824B
MTDRPLPMESGDRYPGFHVLSQRRHWDDATRAVVESRVGTLPQIRFFTVAEEAAATALFDQLLDQRAEPKVPITRMVDVRLAEGQFDGWHHDSMPPDDQAWRQTLALLDDEARERCGRPFAECRWNEQNDMLAQIHDSDADFWRGMPRALVWNLWNRYACTAFYSHPSAWDEIGFAGPAYPRGYKNIGIDRLEPFEVRDVRPQADPLREKHDE